eukprot:scaffold123514_cov63-Phaeocystis_antarctica.AAC.1
MARPEEPPAQMRWRLSRSTVKTSSVICVPVKAFVPPTWGRASVNSIVCQLPVVALSHDAALASSLGQFDQIVHLVLEDPHLWDGLRRAPDATASFQDAQAVRSGVGGSGLSPERHQASRWGRPHLKPAGARPAAPVRELDDVVDRADLTEVDRAVRLLHHGRRAEHIARVLGEAEREPAGARGA